MDGVDADLREGVTDSGFEALASAGCGAHLTFLALEGEWCYVIIVVFVLVVVLRWIAIVNE